MNALRLATAELRTSWQIWFGACVVAAAAAVAASIPATLLEAALRVGGVAGLALGSIAGTAMLFTVIAVLGAFAPVMRLTISLTGRTLALWQVVGVLPRTVTVIVLVEVSAVSATGGVIGTAAGAAVAPALVADWLRSASGFAGITPEISWSGAPVVVVAVVFVAVVGSIRAAVGAGRTAPALILRGAPPAARSMVARSILAAALVAVVAQMLITLPGTVRSGAPSSVLIGPLIIATVATLGRAVAVPLLAAWTIVGSRMSTVFSIARSSAIWSAQRSSAAVVALLLAIGLPAAVEAGSRTVAPVVGAAHHGTGGTLILLGGPTLLGAVGGAAVTFMTSRARHREQSIFRAMGAAPSFGIAGAVVESVSLLGTALLLATIAVVVTALAEWTVLVGSYPAVRPAVPVGTLLQAGALCTPLVLAASVAPVLHAINDPMRSGQDR